MTSKKTHWAQAMARALVLCLPLMPIGVKAQGETQPQGKTYHGDGIDNVLEYIPLATTLTLKAAGVEGASSWKRLAVNGVLSMGITAGTTYVMKHTIHDMRPDRTDNRAFPSGHTAVAFAGARVLDKEYRHLSPWISVGGYAMATLTAIDRVRRNRHHWDDVVVGAALGVAATEAGYWLGDKLTGERSRWHLGTDGQTLSMRIDL